MKNLIVKEMSHQEKHIPSSTDNVSVFESESIRSGFETFLISPKIFSNDNISDAGLFKTIEIKLSVEKLVPNTNFINIWIGEQLMTGTIADEKNQTIKGYVRKTPSDQDRVFIEYPNGEKKEFKVPIADSSSE